MVSSLDIFGLGVGLAYAIATPFAVYWLLGRILSLNRRDAALGALGYVVADALHRLYVHPILSAILGAFEHSKYHPDPYIHTFTANWLFGFGVVVEMELGAYLLLRAFASRATGIGPGVAYGIGRGAVYCCGVGAPLSLSKLQAAFILNAKSVDPLYGVAVSPEWSVSYFEYGIPQGVSTAAHFMIAVGLSLLVWKSVVEGKRIWLGVAIGIDGALIAPVILIEMGLLPISRNGYEALLGLLLVGLLCWLRRRPRGRSSREGDPGGLVELFLTWRGQSRRAGPPLPEGRVAGLGPDG
jgi:uncharacterized membrane protein YhfC